MKLISSSLSRRKFRVSIIGELSTPWDVQAEVAQGSVLSPTFCGILMTDTPQTPGVCVGLLAEDTGK
jgi:hypothetical protein